MFLAEILPQADLSALSLGPLEILFRLLCAMFIGAVVGTEREYTHRPAGMRTHMLVSLGSCAVMVTSQLIFVQYRPFGATPDPSRLSAQVITGVGFLGAGTILREGPSIKGLTTAASLWAVACLGIAVGGGYYAVALLGTACMMVTLTVFEAIQKKLMRGRNEIYLFFAEGRDAAGLLELCSLCAREADVELKGLQLKRIPDNLVEVTFRANFSGKHPERRFHNFLSALSSDPRAGSVRSQRYQT